MECWFAAFASYAMPMKQIANSIIGIWLFSIALTLSPYHTFANKVNYYYTAAYFAVIYLSSRAIFSAKPVLGSSILRSKVLRLIFAFFSSVLLLAALVVGLLLYINGEGSLGSNREIFEQKYAWFNYIYILSVPTSIVLSLSRHSSKVESLIAKFAWLMCVIVLLFSGNRQFAFFSIVYLSFYYLGKSSQPALLMRRLFLVGIFFVLLTILFSIIRLDYLPRGGANVVARYMSSLTGATCTNDAICSSPIETGYQLLYAYLGMNHSGFAYSADFFIEHGGYPFLSITAPLVYRRVQQVGLGADLNVLDNDLESYIASVAGDNYSHFFSTMFGAVIVEGWWPAFIAFSVMCIFLMRILSVNATKSNSTEVDYLFFILMASSLVFGIMQFPMTEPFFTMIFLELFFIYLLNIFYIINWGSLRIEKDKCNNCNI